jgi:hypothetical protein
MHLYSFALVCSPVAWQLGQVLRACSQSLYVSSESSIWSSDIETPYVSASGCRAYCQASRSSWRRCTSLTYEMWPRMACDNSWSNAASSFEDWSYKIHRSSGDHRNSLPAMKVYAGKSFASLLISEEVDSIIVTSVDDGHFGVFSLSKCGAGNM